MSAPRPNVLFVMADDHAAGAVSANGSRIMRTPAIDRLGSEGARFDRAFCENSLCTPSRAAILTGVYSHVHGATTLDTPFDARQPAFPGLLRDAGYQTMLVGKWHLGHGGVHDPNGFDRWSVLPDQGEYHDPTFLQPGGRAVVRLGYVTDVITDVALAWLAERDRTKPFCLLVHHKAPHRPWEPAPRHAGLFECEDVPEPPTLRDDYSGRASPAREARMRIAEHLTEQDLKGPVPPGLSGDAELCWRYQRYIKDYLRCVAALDDSVRRLLDALDAEGVADDTVVVYTSDQGFFLGEHGWYDKRFMDEGSIRMPLLVRYPRLVPPGSVMDRIVVNVDFAPTLLELGGAPIPDRMQGRSLVPLLTGTPPPDWRTAMYYRYWMHLDSIHRVGAHYGIRTERFKLIHYYGQACGQPGAAGERQPPEWELFDLTADPFELSSVYHDPQYATVVEQLTRELHRVQQELGDTPANGSAGRQAEHQKGAR
ncbi:MAG TPA: sulfatase [Jiangellaceae bacterium]